tara:strand:- start:1167 stop:2165 length:999 start_codon:yes stop_codon:yes gene_type:complete
VNFEKPKVAISIQNPSKTIRLAIEEELAPFAEVLWLERCKDNASRSSVIKSATALIGLKLHNEILSPEWELMSHMSLIQALSAGVDFVPFEKIPKEVPIASNRGAFSIAMAEHGLALLLSSAKDLRERELKMKMGYFDQWSPTRSLHGLSVAIVGFGGIGQALLELLEPFKCKIFAINRTGYVDDSRVSHTGNLSDLKTFLPKCDLVVLTISLNKSTVNIIGKKELAVMKKDAILLNLARGAIINQKALFEHLLLNPHFYACLDAWWSEPFIHGRFETKYDFLSLKNVLGSPHNSAQISGASESAARRGTRNVVRLLKKEPIKFLVESDEKI